MSVASVKDKVAEICGIQAELASIATIPDGALRAEGLKSVAQSPILPAKWFALEQLGRSGLLAVPTIVAMLDDPVFGRDSSELVKALVAAGGESVGSELHTRLQRQLEFWRTSAPSLSRGWWNDDAINNGRLRDRYMLTLELVRGLNHITYRPAVGTAAELRDLWRSFPQLNDPSGISQMADECDHLVQALSERK